MSRKPRPSKSLRVHESEKTQIDHKLGKNMDYYHIWCDLNGEANDIEFAQAVRSYLDHLAGKNLVSGYRITRRKLGFGPENLGEFHIIIETDGLPQLEAAFQQVARRAGTTEQLHQSVFEKVRGVRFGLYRDFPDSIREVPPKV